jgi:Zn-dependent peptidase ImmA (M78 family)
LRLLPPWEFRNGSSAFLDIDGSICVREGLGNAEKRYAIAHELGHLALAHHAIRTSSAEAEAAMFALFLLMPQQAFRIAKRELRDDELPLASVFQVTTTLVNERLTLDTETMPSSKVIRLDDRTHREAMSSGPNASSARLLHPSPYLLA